MSEKQSKSRVSVSIAKSTTSGRSVEAPPQNAGSQRSTRNPSRHDSRASTRYGAMIRAGIPTPSRLTARSGNSVLNSSSAIPSMLVIGDDEDGEEYEDEEMGSSEGTEEQYCGEYDDDEEGECEEVEEETTEEGSSPELSSEYDEDQEMKRAQLIETYLVQQAQYRFLQKKNAYLDDKLYKLCLRKGYIQEGEEKKVNKERRSKKRKKQKIVLHIQSKDDNDVHKESSSELASSSAMSALVRQRTTRLFSTGPVQIQTRLYRTKLRHLMILKRTETEINESVTYHLGDLQEQYEESEARCTEYFNQFMSRMFEESKKAIHSNYGTGLKPEETRQYIEEMRTLFNKLRHAIHMFYKTWHGLNFDLERLEEQEVKDKGLSMLEYEQLQGENITLKDKAEYQEQELEKQRKKIASAVQILAHVREKGFRVDDQLVTGIASLNDVNTQLKDYAERMDTVTQNFAGLRAEQRKLQEQSGLMDNIKLMRDYEKTTGKLTEMKEQKRKIVAQTKNSHYEIQALQNKILLVKQNLPKLQKMATRKAKQSKASDDTKRTEDTRRSVEHDNHEQLKLERLLELLQLRHNEPWKQVQETIIRPNYFTSSSALGGAGVTTITRIPC